MLSEWSEVVAIDRTNGVLLDVAMGCDCGLRGDAICLPPNAGRASLSRHRGSTQGLSYLFSNPHLLR